MNALQNKLNIELCNINNDGCLKFSFGEHFNEDDANTAVKEWKDLIGSARGDKINIIWNCLDMKSYEAKALTTWQQALKQMKNQIENIWLITDSKKLKTGAMLMSAFSELKIKVVKSEEMICNN